MVKFSNYVKFMAIVTVIAIAVAILVPELEKIVIAAVWWLFLFMSGIVFIIKKVFQFMFGFKYPNA